MFRHATRVPALLPLVVVLWGLDGPAAAADLQPKTVAAFDRDVKLAEAGMDARGLEFTFDTTRKALQKPPL